MTTKKYSLCKKSRESIYIAAMEISTENSLELNFAVKNYLKSIIQQITLLNKEKNFLSTKMLYAKQ